MTRRLKYTDAAILAALRKERGLVYRAADRLGCNPDTIYTRAKIRASVRDAIKTERGKVIDLAERRLFDAIDAGEPWAVQLALKTLGKDRGYVERQELTGENGGAIRQRVIVIPGVSLDDIIGPERTLPAARGGEDAHDCERNGTPALGAGRNGQEPGVSPEA